MSDVKKKWEEYPDMRETRELMEVIRTERLRLSKVEVAKAIADETGYHFTGDMYRAMEQGMTKQVPAWVVIAFMKVYDIAPDIMFPSIGRMWG